MNITEAEARQQIVINTGSEAFFDMENIRMVLEYGEIYDRIFHDVKHSNDENDNPLGEFIETLDKLEVSNSVATSLMLALNTLDEDELEVEEEINEEADIYILNHDDY